MMRERPRIDHISIVRACEADAPTLGRIHSLAWRGAYRGVATEGFLRDFDPESRTAFFARILPETENEHYLLFWDDEPVGMLALGPVEAEGSEPGSGEVIALYLLPAYYGRGIGLKAMNHAVSRLRSLGFLKIELTVLSNNLRARRFYERYGFRPTGAESTFWMGREVMERRYLLEIDKGM